MAEPPDAAVSLSVIQFVDRAIEQERRLLSEKLERLREVLTERSLATAEARDVAYMELKAHLDKLNHAQQEMNADRARYLPRETYDAAKEVFEVWKSGVNDQLSSAKGRSGAYAFMAALIPTILAIALHFWK